MKININDRIRIRLTDVGRDILRVQHARLWRSLDARLWRSLGKEPPEWELPEVDGWSEWQIHDLMRTFGEHMPVGVGIGELPFETDMELTRSDDVSKHISTNLGDIGPQILG